ncbi:MAG: RNA-binding protein [Chloroflexota bacterium]
MNIYAGNLPYSCTETQLRETFEEFGEVSSANLIIDRQSGRSKGFGFVEMPDDEAARTAIKELDGTDMDGRPLRVNEAKPKENRY